MSEPKKIALIYFSRTSKAEAKEKSFGVTTTRNQKLSITKYLNTKTVGILKSTQLDLLFFDENNQTGTSFGEKLANAFSSTFDLGYSGAISVGNDCIHLDKIDFNSIAEELKNGVNTLGPTFRNGAYLIALTKSSFDKKIFEDLAWQTPNLKSSLINYFTTLGLNVSFLQTLRDVNNLKDIYKILYAGQLKARIKTQLLSFISFLENHVAIFKSSLNNLASFLSFGLRAPPL